MSTFTVLRIGKKGVPLAVAALSATLSAQTNAWTSIGPEGGIARSLAVDPRNPSTVYAAAPASGIFKTTDGGASWSRLGSAPLPESFGLVSLAIDSKGAVYAAGCPSDRVFKTTDGGASWSAINLPLDRFHGCLQSLAIESQNPDTLYAGGPGIFKTTDGGSSWTQVNFSSGISMLAIDPKSRNDLRARRHRPHQLRRACRVAQEHGRGHQLEFRGNAAIRQREIPIHLDLGHRPANLRHALCGWPGSGPDLQIHGWRSELE